MNYARVNRVPGWCRIFLFLFLFFANITRALYNFAQCTARFAPRRDTCVHAGVRARQTRVGGDACELIENDSSTKRMRAPGNLGKMRRAHRPEEILNRIRLSDFPTPFSLSLSPFFCTSVATRTQPRAPAFVVNTGGGSWRGK